MIQLTENDIERIREVVKTEIQKALTVKVGDKPVHTPHNVTQKNFVQRNNKAEFL